MRRFLGILAFALLALGVASRAIAVAGPVQVVIDCGNPGINGSLKIVYRLDCPGSQPNTYSIAVAGLTTVMTPDQKAAAIVAAILGAISPTGPNFGCNDDPAGGITANQAVGQLSRVEVHAVDSTHPITAFEVNDASQETGNLKGKNGTTNKRMTVSGTAAGGSVTVTINPTVTVNTSPGESSSQVVQDIAVALTNAGFTTYSVVSIGSSGLLDIPSIVNSIAIVAPGHPAGEDGLWVTSHDNGLRAVVQVDLPALVIPTLPQWGLIALAAFILAVGGWVILGRARSRPAPA